MVIADVNRDGNIDVIDRVKETVRLGRRAFETGTLSKEAMDLAVRTLSNFKKLLQIRHVKEMRAVATSAVRETRNSAEFVARIRRETGIKVEIISGVEEARLIFVAARHAMGLEGGPHLLVDIGGGSVELVMVRDGEPIWMRSLRLGVSRLTEQFLTDDPPTPRQVRDLEAHLADEMGALLKDARHEGVERAIGTSGTVNTLVAMARATRGEELGRLSGASASAAEIAEIRRNILDCDLTDRIDLPGMDAKRADLMPASAILTDYILHHSAAPEIVACTWALREGLLLEMAGIAGRRESIDARKHSVAALAQKFEKRNEHGQTVARLAGQIFDATAQTLELPDHAREILEYAALLHDIGHSIDHDRHNRHSYYLIKNADLFGFTPDEIEVIAQVARGHRKQGAKVDSPEICPLSEEQRRMVRALAAILRVADGLDRTHFGVVKNVHLSYAPGKLYLDIDSGSERADLELWTSERRIELLAKLLDRRIVLRQRVGGRRKPALIDASAAIARRRRAV
ncbi:MAG TPA: Ppx/GppA phosphatase family protein [Candidatus Binataceae bacterium]|nr:Ppx/GppA phosphatase family protein [Candidatus Binataceae bacterium]